MVLVHCTSSRYPLSLYEVSTKSLEYFWSYDSYTLQFLLMSFMKFQQNPLNSFSGQQRILFDRIGVKL